ncbi:Dabb family protein [Geodermatophilus sp. SYSU D00703]
MPVLHIAMFEWKPEVTREQVAALCADLATMPGLIGGVRSYRFGPDLGLREGNLDFGVVAELESAADVDRYLDHPAHRRLVEQHILGMAAARRAVQIDLDPSARHGAHP